MEADDFKLSMLINSMKELRELQLNDQVREALENAQVKLNPKLVDQMIDELETDIEEHIERLERMAEVMTPDERDHPEQLEGTRRQEVAFQSGCDLEEVDSLCEAFSRAREILAGLKEQGGGVLDVKLLFGNLPGFGGIQIGEGDPSNMIQGLLDGKLEVPSSTRDLDKLVQSNDEFEELFDLGETGRPRNRLPRDWKP